MCLLAATAARSSPTRWAPGRKCLLSIHGRHSADVGMLVLAAARAALAAHITNFVLLLGATPTFIARLISLPAAQLIEWFQTVPLGFVNRPQKSGFENLGHETSNAAHSTINSIRNGPVRVQLSAIRSAS